MTSGIAAKRPWALALAVLLSTSAWVTAQTPPANSPRPSFSDNRIAFFQKKVREDPEYWISYDRLATAYVLKSRETGDISYLELAEAALRKSLSLNSTDGDAGLAFVDMAIVHLAEHRFEEAFVDADHAIKLFGDRDATPLPYAADAQLEFGNYDAAQALYDRALDFRDGKPHNDAKFLVLSHGAGLHWIKGDDKLATNEMKEAARRAEDMHLPPENIAWTHFMLGEQLFQAGDLPGAEGEEQTALGAFPLYHRAMAEMGRIRAAQHRFPESVTFYRKALGTIPLPIYAASLGDVYTAMGNHAEAEKCYALVAYIAKLSALGQQVFNRELVYFYADHNRELPLAVKLARQELNVRHDIYTSDALAWALFKSGDAAAAREPMEQAIRFSTKDALLEYHAGMIYARLGEKAQAEKHLQRALALNPNFHVLYASSAQHELTSLRSTAGLPPATGSHAR